MRRPLPPRGRAPRRPRSRGSAWQAHSFRTPPDTAAKLHDSPVTAAVDDHIIHELSHHWDSTASVLSPWVLPPTAVTHDHGRDVVLQAGLDVDPLVRRAVGV